MPKVKIGNKVKHFKYNKSGKAKAKLYAKKMKGKIY